MSKRSADDSLHCSFCRKNEKTVGKLIANPRDYPRAYICDECIGVCAHILADDQATPEEVPLADSPHALLTHPLAPNLMEALERWIREEMSGKDGHSLDDVYVIATRMVTDPRFQRT
jgi:ATP-dependent protease Clp ATPase subunit